MTGSFEFLLDRFIFRNSTDVERQIFGIHGRVAPGLRINVVRWISPDYSSHD